MATVDNVDPYIDEVLIRSIRDRAGELGDLELEAACDGALEGGRDWVSCMSYVRAAFESMARDEQAKLLG